MWAEKDLPSLPPAGKEGKQFLVPASAFLRSKNSFFPSCFGQFYINSAAVIFILLPDNQTDSLHFWYRLARWSRPYPKYFVNAVCVTHPLFNNTVFWLPLLPDIPRRIWLILRKFQISFPIMSSSWYSVNFNVHPRLSPKTLCTNVWHGIAYQKH